jgi:hypothetical protein
MVTLRISALPTQQVSCHEPLCRREAHYRRCATMIDDVMRAPATGAVQKTEVVAAALVRGGVRLVTTNQWHCCFR